MTQKRYWQNHARAMVHLYKIPLNYNLIASKGLILLSLWVESSKIPYTRTWFCFTKCYAVYWSWERIKTLNQNCLNNNFIDQTHAYSEQLSNII